MQFFLALKLFLNHFGYSLTFAEHKNLPAYQWTYKSPDEEQENDSPTKAKL